MDDLEKYIGGIWRIVSKGTAFLQYASILLALLIFLCCVRNVRKIPAFFSAVFSFQCLYLVSDLINGIDVKKDLMHVILVFCFGILVLVYHSHGMLMKLVRVTVSVLEVVIFTNLLSIFLFPKGLYHDTINRTANYFLGYKNRHIYYFLPFLGLSCLYDIEKEKRVSTKTLAYAFGIIIFSGIMQASTTVAAIGIAMLLIVLYKNKRLPQAMTVLNVFISSVAITFLFISFSQLPLLNRLTYSLFGKTAAFSGRTTIWDAAITLFQRKPIMGNGNTSDIALMTWADIVQAHNKYLDILYVGGVVMMGAFILLIALLSRKINDCPQCVQKNIVVFTICGYAILFLMESAKADPIMYYYFMIVYSIERFDLIGQEKPGKVRVKLR